MLAIEKISLRLGQFELNRVSFEVEKGEYFVLLGMSGSGKSVLLQVIAGLIPAGEGGVFLNGREITGEKVQKRGVGLVFQDAALFPNMNVYENIAYPLKARKRGRREIEKEVHELARLTGVDQLLKRSTVNLSGGEKQRVALARALALKPECLLLDEPLSSLDAQLRHELRSLLRKLNHNGQTIIHVTHDYEEAVLLAQRIGVIEGGTVVQQGTPSEVFQHPRSEFVARFTGIRNFFSGTLLDGAGTSRKFRINDIEFFLLSDEPPGEGFIVVRAEDIILSESMARSSAVNNFRGVVTERIPARMGTEVVVDIGIRMAVVLSDESAGSLGLEEGREIWISFKASALKFIRK